MKLQDYSAPESIPGVKVLDLPLHYDDGGSFMEIARLEAGTCQGQTILGVYNDPVNLDLDPFSVEGLEGISSCAEVQVNYSVVQPGVVKAFHVHKEQTDVFFIPPGQRFIVGLFDADDYDESDTVPQLVPRIPRMRIITGPVPKLIVIPPGVAHGLKNIGTEPAHMLYLVNRHFNPEDEWRIPWDVLGKDFWEVRNG